MIETRLSKIAEQLLLVADRIHDAEFLTDEHVDCAARLLWGAYEAGAFPNDELFSFAVARHFQEWGEDGQKPDCRGFAEMLIHYWLRVRAPGIRCLCETNPEQALFVFCHAIRQIARMMLGTADDTDDPIENALRGRLLPLYRCLKSHRHAVSYDTLAKLDCWRNADPEDSAIRKALKEMQSVFSNLGTAPTLKIEHKYRRVKYTPPG